MITWIIVALLVLILWFAMNIYWMLIRIDVRLEEKFEEGLEEKLDEELDEREGF
jgi:hypothetical protein